MQKSRFGSPSVKIFGYQVSFGKHNLDEDGKKVINKYTMPTTIKGIESFHRGAFFFESRVVNFSDNSANL